MIYEANRGPRRATGTTVRTSKPGRPQFQPLTIVPARSNIARFGLTIKPHPLAMLVTLGA
jgi:hypothetical protein